MEERTITPVHFYDNYGDYFAAISLDSVVGDVFPYQPAWQYFRDAGFTFDEFCEFLDVHNVENWFLDDGDGKTWVRLRMSHLRQAASKTGLMHKLKLSRSESE